MAKVRKRVYGPTQLPNTTGTRYTVPASTKSILKRMHFSNPTGGAVTITWSIGADAAGTRLFDAYSIPAGTVLELYPEETMETTEVLAMHASAATSVVATVNADEYTLG